jgi:2Fe-2S ferredoxin
MPTVHLITADGRRRSLQARPRQTLMRAAVDAGVAEIAAECGGVLSCATCHVMINAPWAERLPAPTADEAAMLELTAVPRETGSRLACQVVLDDSLDGLVARLPVRQY